MFLIFLERVKIIFVNTIDHDAATLVIVFRCLISKLKKPVCRSRPIFKSSSQMNVLLALKGLSGSF